MSGDDVNLGPGRRGTPLNVALYPLLQHQLQIQSNSMRLATGINSQTRFFMKPTRRSLRPMIQRLFQRIFPRVLSGSIIILSVSVVRAVNDEPSYNGRLLSQWLGDVAEDHAIHVGLHPTLKVVQAMGTNAIPTLLKWMCYEPSPAESEFLRVNRSSLWRPITNLNRYPAQRAERAAWAFDSLGAVARSTIPVLTHQARTATDYKRANRFTCALSFIGTEAVFSLVSLATNSPPWTRRSAVEALADFARDQAVAATLVPMLMNILCDTNSNAGYPVDGPAQGALLAMDPEVVVPVLTNALKSASVDTRRRAIETLLAFDLRHFTNVAPTVVPAVRAAMDDSDDVIRSIAIETLRGIGGWKLRGDKWVPPHGTNTQYGITPDVFSKAPPR